jgi:hypothetical protein
MIFTATRLARMVEVDNAHENEAFANRCCIYLLVVVCILFAIEVISFIVLAITKPIPMEQCEWICT